MSAEFHIYDGDEFFANVMGPREQAWGEAMHYASQCTQPSIEEVTRVVAPMGEEPPPNEIPYAGLTRDALKRLADAVDDIATDDNLMRPAQRVAQLRGVATDARAALAKTTSPEIGQHEPWTCDGCKATFANPVNGLCPKCGCNLIDKAEHDPADPLYWKTPSGPVPVLAVGNVERPSEEWYRRKIEGAEAPAVIGGATLTDAEKLRNIWTAYDYEERLDAMVDRFLAWPLPSTVCSDSCVTDPTYPHRIGTNLLTSVEARAMLEHVLAVPVPSQGIVHPCERKWYCDNGGYVRIENRCEACANRRNAQVRVVQEPKP